MVFNPNYNSLAAGVFQTFVSRPDLNPPLLNVQGNGTPGLVLFNQVGANVHQPALLIADHMGDIVYVDPITSYPNAAGSAFDFNMQTINGQQVLSFWAGTTILTHSSGNYYWLDNTLKLAGTLQTASGTSGDLHEFSVLSDNTVLVSFYYVLAMNLARWGGPTNGFVYGSGFQRINLANSQVLFQWKSTDHVSPDASLAPIGSFNGDGTNGSTGGTGPWDYFHINSVDVHPTDGTYLISARHTSSIYKIANNSTGSVIWTITGASNGKAGGKGDFFLGSGANFEWQHHVRWRSATSITIFDNASQYRITVNEAFSRGLVLSLNTNTVGNFTATLTQAYQDSSVELSGSQGAYQTLPNGNAWMSYGDVAVFAEFSPTGSLLCLYQTSPAGADVESYRSYKVNYTTSPTTTPDIAISNRTVFVSWNGATQVTQWAIRSGTTSTGTQVIATVPKNGFETSFVLPSSINPATNFTRVDALGSSGQLLASSPVIQGANAKSFKKAVKPIPAADQHQGRYYI